MDPRIAKTHAAVMQAATDLLVEGGPAALTMDAVVARSGVAKSTLYRHWATRDVLVADVFAECAPAIEAPAADVPFEDALRTLTRSFVHILKDEQWSRLAPALLLLSAQQTEIADIDSDLKRQQHDVIEEILRRGVAEGALDPDLVADTELAVALLAGPVLIAGLTKMTPLDEALADRSVDQFLAGHRPH